jgi:hypothetical protein
MVKVDFGIHKRGDCTLKSRVVLPIFLKLRQAVSRLGCRPNSPLLLLIGTTIEPLRPRARIAGKIGSWRQIRCSRPDCGTTGRNAEQHVEWVRVYWIDVQGLRDQIVGAVGYVARVGSSEIEVVIQND